MFTAEACSWMVPWAWVAVVSFLVAFASLLRHLKARSKAPSFLPSSLQTLLNGYKPSYSPLTTQHQQQPQNHQPTLQLQPEGDHRPAAPHLPPINHQNQQPPKPSPHPPLPQSSAHYRTPSYIPDLTGEHRITFADGSVYAGQLRHGKPEGRGVLVWTSGERYEGEWKGGKEHGQGAFSGLDGAAYYGTWREGEMHGRGVFKPGGGGALQSINTTGITRLGVVYLREYDQGQLVKETELDVSAGALKKQQYKEERKKKWSLGQQALPGEHIYKGHRSYELMKELQLGVMYSIAQSDWQDQIIVGEDHKLDRAAFSEAIVQYFPASIEYESFKWKDYAPKAFHRLRRAFGVDNSDYLLSVTGVDGLKELPSPGASGSVFFISEDDRFFIKSIRKGEMGLLLSLIKQYHDHVVKHPGTLLVPFFGVHRVSPFLGHNARFVVMGNVLPSGIRLHRRYDLKGSCYKRTIEEGKKKNDPNAILKDLDLDTTFELIPERFTHLMRQLHADCDLLEAMHVIDYSLLLGVHFLGWGSQQWYPPQTPWPLHEEISPTPPGAVVESVAAQGGGEGSKSLELGLVQQSTGGLLEVVQEEEGQEEEEDFKNEDEPDAPTSATPALPPSAQNNNQSLSQTQTHSLHHSMSGVLRELSTSRGELSSAAVSVLESAYSSRKLARQYAATAAPPCAGHVGIRRGVTPPVPSLRVRFAAEDADAVGDDGQNQNGNGIERSVESIRASPFESPDRTLNNNTNTNTSSTKADRYGSLLTLSDSTSSGIVLNGQRSSKKAVLKQSRSSTAERGCSWAVPAVAIQHLPDGSTRREPVLLYFGIIDFLQDYTVRKRAERAWKVALHGRGVSVSDPKTYRKRFEEFLKTKVFVKCPP